MKTESARFLVEGRVQGVGFRWWTHRTAASLGLRGTVRNLPDGRVEVRVEGSPEAVARMADLLADGPRPARVDRVVREEGGGDHPPDFRIVG